MYQVKFNGGGQGISRVANVLPYALYSKRRRAQALINTFTRTHPPILPQLPVLSDTEVDDAGDTYYRDWIQLYDNVLNLADVRDDLNDLLISIYQMVRTYTNDVRGIYETRLFINNLPYLIDFRNKYYIRWLQLSIQYSRLRNNTNEMLSYERELENFMSMQQLRLPPHERMLNSLDDELQGLSGDESDDDLNSGVAGGLITALDKRMLTPQQQLNKIQYIFATIPLTPQQTNDLNDYGQRVTDKNLRLLSNQPIVDEVLLNRPRERRRVISAMRTQNRPNTTAAAAAPPPPPSPNENGGGNMGNKKSYLKNKRNANKSHTKRRKTKSRKNKNKSRKN